MSALVSFQIEDNKSLSLTDINISKNKLSDIQNQRTFVSFFCGCGGMDLGFLGNFSFKDRYIDRTNFEIIAAYDNNEKCIATYKSNISQKAEIKDLSNYKAKDVPKADVLIGGFPCQDFATCGPREGLQSTRGRLYKSMIRYMREHSPYVVVGENVLGLATMSKGSVLKTITKDISKAGYNVDVWKLYAPDYGIPQTRTRLFIVGVRKDLPGFPQLPDKTHTAPDYPTTRWAIQDLENIENESIPNQSQFFKANKAKKGHGQGDETTLADSPSYTIRANAKSRVQFHYSLQRRLTIRECARLQTFPDSFVFPHHATTNIMQIGNAVPPLLANKVAVSISQYLEVTI